MMDANYELEALLGNDATTIREYNKLINSMKELKRLIKLL
jgi:hypothetical protein